jgi:AraC-like DNA-binding protein
MTYPKGSRLPGRYVYDYELEFFVESDGGMFIDDKYYPVEKGDVVFRRPGQFTQAVMPYCCYMICFDPSGTAEKDPDTYDLSQKSYYLKYYKSPVITDIPSIYRPVSQERCLTLFDLVLKEFINPSETSVMLMKAYVLQILDLLYREIKNPVSSNLSVKKAINYIRSNLDRRLDLKILGEVAGFSPNHFHKIFHEAMGITPNGYITKLRMEKAKELLATSVLPIYEIAEECGFENISYFSYIFKKQAGISPAEFRKMHSYI